MWPFDGMVETLVDKISMRLLGSGTPELTRARKYRTGDQPKQLAVDYDAGQYDDNVILNVVRLVYQRTVSQMLGGGVAFSFDQEEDTHGKELQQEGTAPVLEGEGQGEAVAESLPQDQYIQNVWDANRVEMFLHCAELAAMEHGTGYIYICDPRLNMGGMVGKDGITYPRLVSLEPGYVTMTTLPEDAEVIIRYTVAYTFTGLDKKEYARRREIIQVPSAYNDQGIPVGEDHWEIQDWISSAATGGKWELQVSTIWPFPFAPVVHWKNLPTVGSPYGEPDIPDDLLNLQDKVNASTSFMNKSLRLGQDPFRWGRGLEKAVRQKFGPDRIVSVGPNGEINQLAPAIEWVGASSHLKFLRSQMFDLSRTVDVDSMIDRLGNSPTNFALRVLYQDNVAKIDTKRELMSDALEEVNRRLMLMAGMEAVECECVWQDFVPVNDQEQAAAEKEKIDMGVESKQTAAENLGLDWDQEQTRISEDQQGNDNLGAFLLRNFNQGSGGLEMPGRAPQNTAGSIWGMGEMMRGRMTAGSI